MVRRGWQSEQTSILSGWKKGSFTDGQLIGHQSPLLLQFFKHQICKTVSRAALS